jgi:hypothetical protein
MQHMTEAQRTHIDGLMRSIQRKFVEASMAEVIDDLSEADGLDQLVTRTTLSCRQHGANFSETLVRELIFEIHEEYK